jgi:glycosyltransferase involved in cell wall biosynthesis
MMSNTLLFRRTIDLLKIGGRQEAPSRSGRSIFVDIGSARICGWNRVKIVSPGEHLQWVRIEAIDNAGMPMCAFSCGAPSKHFACYVFLAASAASLRLGIYLAEPGDAAISATLRSIPLIEFIWSSLFPKKSWRLGFPANESRFLRQPLDFLRSYLRPPSPFIVTFNFPSPALSIPAMVSASAQRRRHEPPELPMLPREGLCITGYLRSEIGLGQAARNLAYACDNQRLPLSFRSLPLAGRENDQEFATKCNQIRDRKANLLIIGLPAIADLESEIGAGQLNILYPFWELSRVRPEWLTRVRRFDEVWAPTTFVASAFAETLGRPVRLVHQPIRLPSMVPPPRSERDTLRLFTYLDFDSFGERKNPTAAVNAFRAAFKPTQRDVELVIKVHGTESRGLRGWLGGAAAGDRRIKVIDRTLDRTQMDQLMAGCDVFISLHRSEGFGLGPAEALAAGRAVVATNYGGTTDFITQTTGYPIDYTLEAVRPGEYIDSDRQVWAAPRQDAAVAALRSIYEDPAEANARTARGFAVLHAQNAAAVVGAKISSLLHELGAL